MMKRMRRKVKVMEGQILEVRKIPLMKRKKGKDVDMEEQNKMRRVMERWRRKEALNKVDDKPDDGGNGENVEDVKTVAVAVVDKKKEKSVVQRAKDKFVKMSQNKEDTFKQWRERRL